MIRTISSLPFVNLRPWRGDLYGAAFSFNLFAPYEALHLKGN